MDILRIKKIINKAIKHELITGNLAQLVIRAAEKNGKPTDIQEAKKVSRFVIEYVQHVPMYLKEGIISAEKFGIRHEMNQMMFDLEYYWLLEHDLIPDSQGLIGVCDDSFATMILLQKLSDYCVEHNSRPLLTVDFTKSNEVIRRLIGEEIAMTLEHHVSNTIESSLDNPFIVRSYNKIFDSGFAFGQNPDPFWSETQLDGYLQNQMAVMGYDN